MGGMRCLIRAITCRTGKEKQRQPLADVSNSQSLASSQPPCPPLRLQAAAARVAAAQGRLPDAADSRGRSRSAAGTSSPLPRSPSARSASTPRFRSSASLVRLTPASPGGAPLPTPLASAPAGSAASAAPVPRSASAARVLRAVQSRSLTPPPPPPDVGAPVQRIVSVPASSAPSPRSHRAASENLHLSSGPVWETSSVGPAAAAPPARARSGTEQPTRQQHDDSVTLVCVETSPVGLPSTSLPGTNRWAACSGEGAAPQSDCAAAEQLQLTLSPPHRAASRDTLRTRSYRHSASPPSVWARSGSAAAEQFVPPVQLSPPAVGAGQCGASYRKPEPGHAYTPPAVQHAYALLPSPSAHADCYRQEPSPAAARACSVEAPREPSRASAPSCTAAGSEPSPTGPALPEPSAPASPLPFLDESALPPFVAAAAVQPAGAAAAQPTAFGGNGFPAVAPAPVHAAPAHARPAAQMHVHEQQPAAPPAAQLWLESQPAEPLAEPGQLSDTEDAPAGAVDMGNGDRYVGSLDEGGQPHGEGRLLLSNGNSYVGGLRHGLKSGRGVFKWRNGDVYEGDFVDDRFHGAGRFTFCNSDVEYVGEFRNGSFVGRMPSESQERQQSVAQDASPCWAPPPQAPSPPAPYMLRHEHPHEQLLDQGSAPAPPTGTRGLYSRLSLSQRVK